MDLNQLANLGEFIGGVAVLVTLVYLAFQVRQGNQLQRAEAIRTFMREYNDTLAWIRQPAFTEVWRLGSKHFEDLSRNDQTRVATWLEQAFRTGFAGFVMDPKGKNPVTQLVDTTVSTLVRLPGFARWWDLYRKPYEQICPDYLRKLDTMGTSFPSVYEFAPWLEPAAEKLQRGLRS